MDRMDKLTTLFESDEQLYFCVGLIILVGAFVIICAMVNDYREYLDAHLRTRFRLREFLREEKAQGEFSVDCPRTTNQIS